MEWAAKNWNDVLAVPMVIGIPVLLTLVYALGIPLPEMVVGGLIAGWSMSVTYYFRKAPPPEGTE